MREQDRVEAKRRYRERWLKYGYDPQSLGWTKDCQWVRFAAAFEGLREEDCSSVLDFGCGFGDLLAFLRSKRWQGYYTGVELVEELMVEAAKRHSTDTRASFVYSDLEDFSATEKAAMAVAIGVFNHRLHQDNIEFARSA